MADKKMYKVGITVKEPWASDISYEVLDITLYAVENGGDGCSYIAIKANQGVTPGTDDTVWVKSTQAGQSIYDLAVKYHHFVGTEEEFEKQYQDALAAANDAAAAASATDEEIKANELSRVSAENGRVSAEQSRVSAEQSRVSAESARVSAESERVSAESSRELAEATRDTNESGRVTAENGRVSAEQARVSAEQSRLQQFEALKTDMNTAIDNVDAKAAEIEEDIVGYEANEAARVSAEQSRVSAESSRVSAESARVTAETERVAQASSDHTRAETDHGTAASDHTTAAGDHTQAGNDHIQAESDHSTAAADHTQAGADHTASETATQAAIAAAEAATEAAETIDEKIAGKADESEVSQLRSDVSPLIGGGSYQKEITWISAYVTLSGVVTSSTASITSQPFLLRRGETVTIGTNNTNIGIICKAPNGNSIAVGSTVSVIQRTPSASGFNTFSFTPDADTWVVLCVRASDYTLSFSCQGAIYEIQQIDKTIWGNLTFSNIGYINATNGNLVASSPWFTTDFIPVNPGDVIKTRTYSVGTVDIAWYNSEKGFLSAVSGTASDDKTFTAPAGVSYFRVSNNPTSDNCTSPYIRNEAIVYQRITEALHRVKPSVDLFDSINKPIVFNGKTMRAFGDSITWGVSSPNLTPARDDRYISRFAAHVGATLYIHAESGSTLTTGNGTHPSIYTKITSINSPADIIWVMGGVNDWQEEVTVGDFSDNVTTTVYGAMNAICSYIKTTWPNAAVIFVTPIPTTSLTAFGSTHPDNLDDYRKAIQEVAAANGFNVVNGASLGLPNETGGFGDFMCAPTDCIHPTIAGHAMLARSLAGKLL